MSKVKDRLLKEKAKMTAVEERKQQRDAKRMMKQTRAQVIQDRNQQKKASLDAIKRWKHDRNNEDGDSLPDLDSNKSGKGKPSKGGNKANASHRGPNGKPNPKRAYKNEKYGFGGKKRNIKSNDSKSFNDASGFSAKGMKSSKGFVKSSRPGKRARSQRR